MAQTAGQVVRAARKAQRSSGGSFWGHARRITGYGGGRSGGGDTQPQVDPWVAKYGQTKEQIMASEAAKQAEALSQKYRTRGKTETAQTLSTFSKLVEREGSVKAAEKVLMEKTSYLQQLKQQEAREAARKKAEEQRKKQEARQREQQQRESQLKGETGFTDKYTPGFMPSVEAGEETTGEDVLRAVSQPETQIKTGFSEISPYEKLDRALFGLLPGGESPTKVTQERFKTEGAVTKAVIKGMPILEYYRVVRPIIAGAVSKVGEKVFPDPEKELRQQFKKAQELESQGELKVVRGFERLNPFSKQFKTDPDLIKAVKAGRTFEDYYEREGVSYRISDIVLREKPFESAELAAETYISSRALGSLGAGVLNKIPGYNEAGRLKTFTYDIPVEVIKNIALGEFIESSAKQKGFTPKQAEVFGTGARIVGAEASANIIGGKVLRRYPITARTTLKKFIQGFQRKIEAGAIEGGLSTDALYGGEGKGTTFFGVGIGGDKLLPGETEVVIPAIKLETEQKKVTLSEFRDIKKELEGKEYTRKQLESGDIKNIDFIIIDKEGRFVGTSEYDLDQPSKTEKQFQIGRIGTDVAGAVFGVITAGTFGGTESVLKSLKGGGTITGTLGYTSDFPEELIGDFATDYLGAFKPFGKDIATTSVRGGIPAISIIEETGDIKRAGDIKKYGGKLKKTEFTADIKTKTGEDVRIEGIKREVDIRPPAIDISARENKGKKQGIKRGGGKSPVKSYSNIVNDVQQNLPATIKQEVVVSPQVPAIGNVPAIGKGRDIIPSIDFTPVIPPTTDITMIEDTVPAIPQTPTFADVPSTVNVQVDVPVFTPDWPVIPPLFPGGGGSGFGFGKRTKRKKSRYLPSLAAVAYGIKGQKPLIPSGISIRPIISSATKISMPKRKKKKSTTDLMFDFKVKGL